MSAIYIVRDGLLRWEGLEIMLSPQEARLLGILANEYPHFVPCLDLVKMIWPAQFPQAWKSSLSVIKHRLNDRMGPTPLSIQSVQGHGYRLIGTLSVDKT